MEHPFATHGFVKHGLSTDDIFVTEQQLQLFARRRGLEAVATWAAECMGLSGREATAYEQGVIETFLVDSVETRLLCRIQTDIERAGKPALSTYADTIFASAVAEALNDLQGHVSDHRPERRSLGTEPSPGTRRKIGLDHRVS